MKDVTYAIVGGGVAAACAVDAIREHDAAGTVAVFSKEWWGPYQRPPLSKEYLQGQAPIESVLMHPQSWYAEHDVVVYGGAEVVEIDAKARTLSLGAQPIHYEKLLLATGATPRQFEIPGADLNGVFVLRTASDAERLRAASAPAKHIVVVGSGFIGMEVAASLRSTGCEVTIVTQDAALYQRFGSEVSGYAKTLLERHGVGIEFGTSLKAIQGDGRVTGVTLQSGRSISCEAVVVGIGVVPNVDLASHAGLHVDNGIVVDSSLRTSDPQVFAAGDVARFPGMYGQPIRVEHFDHAFESGHCAGANMAGASETYRYVPFFWSDVFELGFEFVGDPAGVTTVATGTIESGSFVVEYNENGKLRGALLAARDSAERDAYRERLRATAV